jgi:hypothetical protein
MGLRRLLLLAAILGLGQTGSAQSPAFGVGRPPTPAELRAWDISISPDGAELPPGHGTPTEGATVFVQKGCAGCHGKTGSGSMAPTLIRSEGTSTGRGGAPCLAPCVNNDNVIALRSPFATVIWDYINRGMPLGKEGTLKPDEVYALTAFLLYKNGVIHEDDVMDARSLPKVAMPNSKGFALPEEWKHGTPRLQPYP